MSSKTGSVGAKIEKKGYSGKQKCRKNGYTGRFSANMKGFCKYGNEIQAAEGSEPLRPCSPFCGRTGAESMIL